MFLGSGRELEAPSERKEEPKQCATRLSCILFDGTKLRCIFIATDRPLFAFIRFNNHPIDYGRRGKKFSTRLVFYTLSSPLIDKCPDGCSLPGKIYMNFSAVSPPLKVLSPPASPRSFQPPSSRVPQRIPLLPSAFPYFFPSTTYLHPASC